MGEVQSVTFCTLQMTDFVAVDSPSNIVLMELELELVDFTEVALATIEFDVCLFVLAMSITVSCIARRIDAASASRVAVITSMKNESATARIGSHHVDISDSVTTWTPLREKLGLEGVGAILNRLLPLKVSRGLLCIAGRQCIVGGHKGLGLLFCGHHCSISAPLDRLFCALHTLVTTVMAAMSTRVGADDPTIGTREITVVRTWWQRCW